METELESSEVRGLYSTAQLAGLVHAPATAIRRWQRREFLHSTTEVRRVVYFETSEVYVARILAELLAAGCSLASIDAQADELAVAFPKVDRPFKDLPLVVSGQRLLIRRGEELLEPSGQMQLDFDHELDPQAEQVGVVATLAFKEPLPLEGTLSADQLCIRAEECENHGDLQGAIEAYRLVAALPTAVAEDHFVLGDCLYRVGDLAGARERFYVAIELDANYAEAYLNLGCVLVELGEIDLAEAALRGALQSHFDYADAHYHLARLLEQQENAEAATHWQRVLELAPDSPWKSEAQRRMNDFQVL